MNVLRTLTSNYIVNVGFLSFFSAQVLKTIITLIFTKKLNLERLVGGGGMPSSHSALTSSIAVGMARKLGFSSPVFGLAMAFAAIVMYDAMGVRRAAGEQAKVINKLVFALPEFPFFPKQNTQGEEEPHIEQVETVEAAPIMDKELKEFLGHTPMEVLGGCLLGILIAVFIPVT